jgi:hypothetical protein
LGVSVLTELAAQTAEKALGGSLANATATVVNEANTKVKMLLAKELGEASLLTLPLLLPKRVLLKTSLPQVMKLMIMPLNLLH